MSAHIYPAPIITPCYDSKDDGYQILIGAIIDSNKYLKLTQKIHRVATFPTPITATDRKQVHIVLLKNVAKQTIKGLQKPS